MANANASSKKRGLTGIGFFVWGLTLLFIGLKLTNHIDWEWWWIFAPLWGPLLACVAVCGIVLTVVIIWQAIFD